MALYTEFPTVSNTKPLQGISDSNGASDPSSFTVVGDFFKYLIGQVHLVIRFWLFNITYIEIYREIYFPYKFHV